MRATDWITLFNRVPDIAQDAILLATSNGSEVALQNVLRVEEEYVVVKGRVGGTSDMGRIFCLPYSEITYFFFVRDLPKDTLRTIFGELREVERRALTTEEPAAMPVDEPAAEQPADKAEAPVTSLRDKLRAKLKGGSGILPRPAIAASS